jgi:predicted CoA-binding protein
MTDGSDADVDAMLDADTIAVIGCSGTRGKPAHSVPAYLQRAGYEIVPINPHRDELLGRPAADSLADVTQSIDVVDVFRPSDEVSGIVDEVLDRLRTRGDVWGLWLQEGIRDDEAAARARAAGLLVVQDRCLKVAHRQRRG